MKFYWFPIIFPLIFHSSTALNQGYRDCLLGTGQQTPLLLQDGLRCVQVHPDIGQNWNSAMDLCNSKQGHLLHIYNSEDAKLLNAWLIERPLTTDPFIGEKKIGPLNGKYTGINVRWFTTKTNNIGIDQLYQYHQYNFWQYFKTREENKQYGATWARTAFADNMIGYGTFTPLIGARHALCQFLSDKPPKTQFRGRRGKRSLAPVYANVEQKNGMSCGISCTRQRWCMGFNAIGSGNGVICQMIAVKQSDTVAGMIEDNGSTYYERSKG